MSDLDPASVLSRRLREGDPRGADALFAPCARRLTRVAEQHLSRKLAGRLDGEDAVQSVFRTFFRRSAAGEFRIDSSAQLWEKNTDPIDVLFIDAAKEGYDAYLKELLPYVRPGGLIIAHDITSNRRYVEAITPRP